MRDAATGEPTGIVIDAADGSLRAQIPGPGEAELDRRLDAALAAAAASGLTGVPEWGRLAPGSRADVTVLDTDPFCSDAANLLKAKVVTTLVEAVTAGGKNASAVVPGRPATPMTPMTPATPAAPPTPAPRSGGAH